MNTLDQEQIQFYQHNGFLRINNFFNRSELEDITDRVQGALSVEAKEAVYFSNPNRKNFVSY